MADGSATNDGMWTPSSSALHGISDTAVSRSHSMVDTLVVSALIAARVIWNKRPSVP